MKLPKFMRDGIERRKMFREADRNLAARARAEKAAAEAQKPGWLKVAERSGSTHELEASSTYRALPRNEQVQAWNTVVSRPRPRRRGKDED